MGVFAMVLYAAVEHGYPSSVLPWVVLYHVWLVL